MEKIFLTFIFLIFSQACFAEMLLYGEAQYNVESALNEVKQGLKTKINSKNLIPYLVDIYRDENLHALLSGNINLKDRELAMFSVGTYGVVYKEDPLHAFYYSSLGILEYIDVRSSGVYPYRSYQYDIKGNLVNMGLRVSKQEAYLYSPDGVLLAHWIGENGYNENGEIIMTRKFVE